MAFAAWKDIIIQHGRSGVLFRIYDAITNRLAGDMAGKWTIVDRSTTDVWYDDLDPVSGDWIVIQCETARAGGEKMQVFIGLVEGYGQPLAGFGSKSLGVYSCMSHDGGWNAVEHVFGADLSDWRNVVIPCNQTYGAPCTMNLVFTSGDTGRPGTFCVVTRSGTGHNAGILAGGLVPLATLAHAVSRIVHLNGHARFDAASAYTWGVLNGTRGRVPTAALDAYDLAYASFTPPARDRETGAYTEADVPITDVATARSVGVLDEVRVTTMPDGDCNVAGDRHAWGGVSYPREAARDGTWV